MKYLEENHIVNNPQALFNFLKNLNTGKQKKDIVKFIVEKFAEEEIIIFKKGEEIFWVKEQEMILWVEEAQKIDLSDYNSLEIEYISGKVDPSKVMYTEYYEVQGKFLR